MKDQPRRLSVDLIERVNAHCKKRNLKSYKGVKKIVDKETFNSFLEKCIDAFEMVKESRVYYAVDIYEDIAEARGQAITKAVKNKTVVEMPVKIVVVGKDEV